MSRSPSELDAPRAAVIVVGAIIVLAAILGLLGGTFTPHKIGMPAPAPNDPITIP
jgi:hypothetical protein